MFVGARGAVLAAPFGVEPAAPRAVCARDGCTLDAPLAGETMEIVADGVGAPPHLPRGRAARVRVDQSMQGEVEGGRPAPASQRGCV